jgi:hypothetical protein
MFQEAINSTTSTIQASQQPNATHETKFKQESKPKSKEKKRAAIARIN